MKKMFVMIVALLVSTIAFAQGTISGSVTDGSTGDPLPGASVLVKGTTNGVTADFDGNFTITANSGDVLVVSYLGFQALEVAAKNGMAVELAPSTTQLEEIVLSSGVIDLAQVRKTPVAVSTIQASEIALKVGNMEFPEVMNKTPGVYATKQGGGYGDSRISLRGFDQRNTSFLINGQPVNDMENGWVYWSNWQGLTDVASGIQIQRGLGASKLAVPSVGGTISIFTKTADKEQGGSVAQMFGNDGYTKTSVSYNTGKNDKGWASSFLLSRWAGDGYAYGTSGEGTTYFFAVGYAPEGSKHSLNLSVLGASQWHHQRSAWVSIRDYQNFGESGIDRRWNTDAGFLNGEEFNMRRNFYNKPLATLNWDYEINDTWKLNTSVYASAGRGGGTGPRGNNYRSSTIDMFPFNKDLTEHYLENGRGTRDSDGFVNYDAVIAHNRASAQPYSGDNSRFQGQLIGSNGFRDGGVSREVLVRRASMNSHDWVGAISNLEGQFGDFKASIGVDLRSYKGYHYRVLNNLMGLDAYYSTGNKNSNGQIINTLVEASPFNDTGIRGPKIDYYNNGIVGWQGVNGLLEYSSNDKLTAVLQAGYSNQSFQREDFFDQPAQPISDVQNQGGGYVKGGANLNMNVKSNVFFNAGYISRQPQFDAVFPNYGNTINPDLQNEIITSIELGYGYTSSKLDFTINLYSTNWGNRFVTQSLANQQGVDGFAQFSDIDVVHNGFEFEGKYRASNKLTLKAMLSIGDWEYTKDFNAEIFDENQQSIGTGTLYTKGAKVGDAAQFTSYVEADYRFGKFNVDLGYRFVDGLYADYSIADSAFVDPNNKGALKLPSYGLVDLGLTYQIGSGLSLRANVNNLLDTEYIAESNTNIHATSGSTTWNGVDVSNSVWFGFGTTWNASLRYRF
ncbi:MAG: TonB-dependent receptor [Flavobacteriaceae bacterium]|jgi:outer membrane cobalamin receptor|nr:TonB-dependent receptor [Flavobacteriaceae bacterium]MDG1774174.1 TonB-dependent receptor [Flavobacteriaceae bacterium]MDG2415715.1 TonB-dependent receptor [Flavobacteriaceae bacterium]